MSADQVARLKEALSGHYQFERELGEGAFATVFLARDLRLERLVAIKVLHIEPSSELNEIRFLREIRFLAALQHPNIVPVHDSGHLESLLYYVMPYVRGESLRERISRQKQMPIDDAVRITCEIADALECAHNSGVIHRDIKPENILLSGTHPMLADFGVARAINVSRSKKITRTGFGSPGTPAYMSPEQMLGESQLDQRTDVYSLGCVLYEMVTGQPPFAGSGGFVRRFAEPAPSARTLRADIPSNLDQTIMKALGRTPDERFASANEMAKALAPRGQHVLPSHVAQRVDEPVDTHRHRRARGTVAIAGGAILLLAAGLTAKEVWRGGKAQAAISTDLSRHIAVLYFDDLSPEKKLASVAAGLTEDLIDQLSQVPGLRVISPNGVRAYRDDMLPLDTISRRLSAGTLVGGSVSTSGAMLRLTVRLIDGATGEQFHSRTFERPSWDFFTLQDSLTTDVAFSLRERLGREIRLREQKSVARSVESWQLVQRGEDLAREGAALLRTSDSAATILLNRADSLFARAEVLDPEWVTPTVDRARNAFASAFLQTERPQRLAAELQRAITYSEQALRKHPNDPEALAVRGEARFRLVAFGATAHADTQLRLAQSDLQASAEARPDLARTWNALGDVYVAEGRFSVAADAYKSAYDADAFLQEIRAVTQMLIFSNLSAGRIDEARRWCGDAKSRFPDDLRFFECKLVILGWSGKSRGEIAAAWHELAAINSQDSAGLLAANARFRHMMVAAVIARAGLRDSARRVIANAPRGTEQERPSLMAEAYANILLGDNAKAISLLSRLASASPQLRAVVAHSPWFDDLRGDAAFQAIFGGGL